MSLEYINQSDFSGGINHTTDQAQIAGNEVLDAEDCFVDAKGLVRRRGPIVWHGKTITNGDLGLDWGVPVVVAAGRHDYGENQGIFAVSKQSYLGASYLTLWFIPYNGSTPGTPKSIMSALAGSSRAGMAAVCPAITKASDSSATSNAKYNRTLISCEAFTVVVLVNKGAAFSSTPYPESSHTKNVSASIDGTTWGFRVTLIAAGIDDSSSLSVGGKVILPKLYEKKFRAAATVGQYTFLAGDSTMTQHFYWSSAEDSTSWASNDFEYAPDLTSSPVRALANLGDSLCILKERSIFMLKVGNSGPTGWSLAQRSASIGTCDQRSVAHWRDSLIFADQRGVYMFDGYDLQTLSDNIAGLWRPVFGQLSNTYNQNWSVCGFTFNDYYVVSITDSAGNFQIAFALHIPTRAWTRITSARITATSSVPDDNNKLVGFHFPVEIPGYASLGAQMVLLTTMLDGCTGTDFLSDGPNMSITTARITSGDRFRSKVWRRVEVSQKSSGNTGALQVEYCTGTDPASTTYTSLGTLPKGTDTKTRFRVGLRSRALSIRIREVSSGGGLLSNAIMSGIRIGLKPMRESRDEGN